MRKQTNFLFYILSVYVVLQFSWWGFHLIQLSLELEPAKNNLNRRVLMIIGEGSVFFILLLLGLIRIRNTIQKEMELSARQSNFLLSVTHELKTPVASTKLFLQTLNRQNLSEEKRFDLTQKAFEENVRLEQLIENILNATRIENKALKPILTEFQFSEFAQKIVERFHKRTTKPFIEMDLKNDALIHADQFLLETILTNLIENAIKYAGENAGIKVYSIATTKSFIFGVKDFGPGIDSFEQKNIFEKFYRVGNEDTRTNKGSGLGLYIVNEFVQLHGGQISYRTNEPKGSIFEVTLPI
jgi:K+-sensing histidine kinase KdpD